MTDTELKPMVDIEKLRNVLADLIKADEELAAKEYPGRTWESPIPEEWPSEAVNQVNAFTKIKTLKDVVTWIDQNHPLNGNNEKYSLKPAASECSHGTQIRHHCDEYRSTESSTSEAQPVGIVVDGIRYVALSSVPTEQPQAGGDARKIAISLQSVLHRIQNKMTDGLHVEHEMTISNAINFLLDLHKPTPTVPHDLEKLKREITEAFDKYEGGAGPYGLSAIEWAIDHLAPLLSVNRELLTALKNIAEAVKSGSWKIDSPTVAGGGDPEIGFETWPEHEEWLHYAEQAIARAKAGGAG